MTTSLVRRAAAEAVGTCLLVAAVVGSGIMGERLAGGNVAIALLANAIAFGLDGSMLEKQSLLESADAVTRSELLLRLLSFRIAAARLPEGPKSLN